MRAARQRGRRRLHQCQTKLGGRAYKRQRTWCIYERFNTARRHKIINVHIPNNSPSRHGRQNTDGALGEAARQGRSEMPVLRSGADRTPRRRVREEAGVFTQETTWMPGCVFSFNPLSDVGVFYTSCFTRVRSYNDQLVKRNEQCGIGGNEPGVLAQEF